MHRTPLPSEWLVSINRMINRMRVSGIEPTDVLLPLMGHSFALPDRLFGLPVTAVDCLAFPYVAVEINE